MLTRDLVLTLALSLVLALWVTTHVALAVGLLRRTPWWRGALALAIAPTAPYFGLVERMRIRSGLWLVLALLYGVLRWRATR